MCPIQSFLNSSTVADEHPQEVEPSNVDYSKAGGHEGTFHVDSAKGTPPVDLFTSLKCIFIAEARNAWIAGLYLVGPNETLRVVTGPRY